MKIPSWLFWSMVAVHMFIQRLETTESLPMRHMDSKITLSMPGQQSGKREKKHFIEYGKFLMARLTENIHPSAHIPLARIQPVWCCLVTKSCPTFLWPQGLQRTRLPCPLSPRVWANVCWVSDAIHHLILFPLSPPALNLSQHQGLFQWVGSLYQVAKVLELQLQYRPFWFPLRLTGLISLQSKEVWRVFSSTTI